MPRILNKRNRLGNKLHTELPAASEYCPRKNCAVPLPFACVINPPSRPDGARTTWNYRDCQRLIIYWVRLPNVLPLPTDAIVLRRIWEDRRAAKFAAPRRLLRSLAGGGIEPPTRGFSVHCSAD